METWFGLHAATYGNTFNEVKQSCLEAEKQGLQLFTIIDHFMNEFHPAQGPHPLECWTTLAGLAAVTEKIRLGPLVSCYRYRHPAVLAKMATTVDHISNGRVVLGLGAGWHEAEFKGYFGEYPSNGERLRGLEETVEICRSMLTNEITNYDGKIYGNIKALNSPQPVQKHLPIMIGGGGEKVTLRIAAENADITHFIPGKDYAKDLKSKLSALRRHCESVGRDYDEIRKGTWMILAMDESMSGAEAKLRETARWVGVPFESIDYLQALCGTPDLVVDRVREYVEMGFGLITFVLVPQPSRADIQLLARDVIGAL
ncbi:MAG: LLM class flavin-dependent oxidoreductase [Candidatus Bathyarchaeia archaeon]|jgi:alkanesulfonate monooxygenase SsuD/methylene tetrahydromethanopterin reductase-like flavin-dependent oxidoreductase (luciferase family)